MNRRASRPFRAALTIAGLAAIACRGADKPAPEPPPATLAPTPVPAPPRTQPPQPTTLAPVPSPPTTVAKPAATTPAKPPVATPPAPPSTAGAPRVDAARVAAILTEAQRNATEAKWREAAELFDDALALDPDNSAARKGKAKVSTTLRGLTRSFVPDLASSEGAEGRLKTMAGFEDVEESNVRRAARVPGRAELDSSAGKVKPGDPYKVEIFVRNLSPKKNKNIKISNVNVKRIVNDKETKVEVDWKPVEVQQRQRALVATVTGTWEDDVTSWVLEVKLLSEASDIYENRLVWK